MLGALTLALFGLVKLLPALVSMTLFMFSIIKSKSFCVTLFVD